MKLLKPLEILAMYYDDENEDPNAALYEELGIKEESIKREVKRKITVFDIENYYPATSKSDSNVLITSGGITFEVPYIYSEFKQLIKAYI